jgi:succinyl-CoA synthetase beta subunit
MRIHEYQAKGILREFGVPVPRGDVAGTPAAARAVADRLGGPVVVKAQVHAGGRGKAGGIKVASSAADAEAAAKQILGMRLQTPQTPPEGIVVRKVLVEEAFPVVKELYLAVTLDREAGAPVVIASEAGGMDIEEVAARSPDRILRAAADPALGLLPFQVRRLLSGEGGLGLDGDLGKAGAAAIGGLYMAFVARDCSLAEINPLVTTGNGRLLALDAKLTFDDSALFRHPEIKALRDTNEETPLEVEASRHGLNYVKLDGTVGCMVNGAGLAMATMDIIKHAGGAPANFLDVGGGASATQIENAFRILLSDPNVRAVLINIFGGILRCDVLADGIVRAARNLGVAVPVVIRMEGTNVEEGRRLLRESGLNFTTADGMRDAAQKVVGLASASPSPRSRGEGRGGR